MAEGSPHRSRYYPVKIGDLCLKTHSFFFTYDQNEKYLGVRSIVLQYDLTFG